jgi:hypothetical protein
MNSKTANEKEAKVKMGLVKTFNLNESHPFLHQTFAWSLTGKAYL